jgi:hypothetical protein
LGSDSFPPRLVEYAMKGVISCHHHLVGSKKNDPIYQRVDQIGFKHYWGHSRLGYYFWDKGLKDYVAVDLNVYHDLLLFDQ